MGAVAIMPILILVVLLVLAVRAVWRGVTLPRGVRAGGPSCGACGYAVADLTSFTCPECGGDLREVGIDTPRREARRRGSLVGALIGWSFLSFVAGSIGFQALRSVGAFLGPLTPAVTSYDWTRGFAPHSGAVAGFALEVEGDSTDGLDPIEMEIMPHGAAVLEATLDPASMMLSREGRPDVRWGEEAAAAWLAEASPADGGAQIEEEAEELAAIVEAVVQAGGKVPALTLEHWRQTFSRSTSSTFGPIRGGPNRLAMGGAIGGFGALWLVGVVLIVRRRRRLIAGDGPATPGAAAGGGPAGATRGSRG